MIQPGAKFLSICEPVKLENKTLAPKIQWWDRHRIVAKDIAIQKGEWKEKNKPSVPSNSEIQLGEFH